MFIWHSVLHKSQKIEWYKSKSHNLFQFFDYSYSVSETYYVSNIQLQSKCIHYQVITLYFCPNCSILDLCGCIKQLCSANLFSTGQSQLRLTSYSNSGLLKKKEKISTVFFNCTFSYIDDVFLLNNSKIRWPYWTHLPHFLEIMETTDTV